MAVGKEIPGVLVDARAAYGRRSVISAWRLWKALRSRYLPREAWGSGLLDPSIPAAAFENGISRSRFSRIQKERNPQDWEGLMLDKGVFYRYCMAAGVPIPPLYGVFFRNVPGWSTSGKLLDTREKWLTFLETECGPEFVAKPARGAYGSGVRVFTRRGRSFHQASGGVLCADELLDALQADTTSDSYVIQERIYNHPDISRLSGTNALQTIRMVTSLRSSGECCIVYAYLKIIVGENQIDNIVHGSTGNMGADVCLETGEITRLAPYGAHASVHPHTHRPILGFKIPCWQEVRRVLEETARKFAPVGTVGWDVAVTSRGPVIIEGNIWYDPPSPPDIHRFVEAVAAL